MRMRKTKKYERRDPGRKPEMCPQVCFHLFLLTAGILKMRTINTCGKVAAPFETDLNTDSAGDIIFRSLPYGGRPIKECDVICGGEIMVTLAAPRVCNNVAGSRSALCELVSLPRKGA